MIGTERTSLAGVLVLVAACGAARPQTPCPAQATPGAPDADLEGHASEPSVQAPVPALNPAETGNALDAEYAGRPVIRSLRGKASYYHDSLAGNHTANGDVYDPEAFTAASRDLAFGTIVRVTRLDNDRTVTVRVNDRGPFGDHRRILDLSRAAAEQLGMIAAGVTDVRAEILRDPSRE